MLLNDPSYPVQFKAIGPYPVQYKGRVFNRLRGGDGAGDVRVRDKRASVAAEVLKLLTSKSPPTREAVEAKLRGEWVFMYAPWLDIKGQQQWYMYRRADPEEMYVDAAPLASVVAYEMDPLACQDVPQKSYYGVCRRRYSMMASRVRHTLEQQLMCERERSARLSAQLQHTALELERTQRNVESMGKLLKRVEHWADFKGEEATAEL